jgi:hypothetical protein
MKQEDIRGVRFGRLVAIERNGVLGTRTAWRVRCDCGTVKTVAIQDLKRGKAKSCGCLLREVLNSPEHAARCKAAAQHAPKRHGMAAKPVYFVWKTMIQRTTNPRNKDWRHYGGAGVQVCDRWRDFVNFYADMGDPNGLTLDRIDPAGNYEPGNCRWADWSTQNLNKRGERSDKNQPPQPVET